MPVFYSDGTTLRLESSASTVATIYGFAGHLLSILPMIRSAIVIASAMADSNAGEGRPSQFASFLAARMLAAMSSTRLRPSSTGTV